MRITKGVVVTIFSCKIDIKLFVGMIGFCALNWRKFKKVFKFQVIWVKQAIFNLIFNGFYVIRFQVTRQKSVSVQSNKAIRACLRSYNIKQGSLHWNSFVRETYRSIYSYQKIRKVESSRKLLKKKLQDKGRFSPIKCLQRNFFRSNCRFLFKLRYKSTQNSFLLCFVSNIRFLHFTESDKMH